MDFCKTDPSRDHRQHSRRYHLWRPASQYSGNGLAKDLPIVGIYRVDPDHLWRSVILPIDSLWLEHRCWRHPRWSRRSSRSSQAEFTAEYVGCCDGCLLPHWAVVSVAVFGIWLWYVINWGIVVGWYIANISRCCRDLHYRCCTVGYFSR